VFALKQCVKSWEPLNWGPIDTQLSIRHSLKAAFESSSESVSAVHKEVNSIDGHSKSSKFSTQLMIEFSINKVSKYWWELHFIVFTSRWTAAVHQCVISWYRCEPKPIVGYVKHLLTYKTHIRFRFTSTEDLWRIRKKNFLSLNFVNNFKTLQIFVNIIILLKVHKLYLNFKNYTKCRSFPTNVVCL
jgi:hypothetical protein